MTSVTNSRTATEWMEGDHPISCKKHKDEEGDAAAPKTKKGSRGRNKRGGHYVASINWPSTEQSNAFGVYYNSFT